MEKSLSIIVPVYNVEKYLGKCLDSLVHQTVSDFEIIVVNDGTKDQSQTIIDKYASKYPSLIKPLIKENGGLSDARNYGLNYACGKYIAFIDSDDYVELDYFEKMLELALKEKSDLVASDIEYIWEEDQHTFFKEGLSNKNIDRNKAMFLSPLFAWNKLYKKEFFDTYSLKYPKGLWYEDIPVTIKYVTKAKKISYLNQVGVHYLQRKSSILGSAYDQRMFHIFDILQIVINNLKEDDLFETYHDEIEYLCAEQLVWYGAFRFLKIKEYKELMKSSFEFMNKYFPNYRNNKYLKDIGSKNRLFIQTNNIYTMHLWHMILRSKA